MITSITVEDDRILIMIDMCINLMIDKMTNLCDLKYRRNHMIDKL